MQLYFSTLGFRYFEFRFIYERIPNRIRIRIFGIFVLALINCSVNYAVICKKSDGRGYVTVYIIYIQ